jgi:hypothetical protein
MVAIITIEVGVYYPHLIHSAEGLSSDTSSKMCNFHLLYFL